MKFLKKINYQILFWILNADSGDAPVATGGKRKIDFAVGGQAVIEGVMMRSPETIAIAVRKPKGDISIDRRLYKAVIHKYKALNVVIVRGVINLFEMMIIGTKAINHSASEALDEGEEQEEGNKLLESVMFALSFVIAIAFSIFLFKFIPLAMTTFLEKYVPAIANNYVLFNFIDGVLKMLIFISYIKLLTLGKDFRRIFEYHGAEHKAIFNYEKNLPLTVENSRIQSRFHPRCGTSFIFIVFAISILVYTFVPKQDTFWMNLLVRLAFLPLIAGISYEYLKLSAKYVNNAFVRALVAPGMWFQRLTTSEPDDSQLEVSIASLEAALQQDTEDQSPTGDQNK